MKKFLLSLAVLALGMSAATAQTTVDFSTAEGLPTVDNTTDVTTATIEGIDFSFFHCKKGTYSQASYLQLSGKNYNGANAAYVEFKSAQKVSQVVITTGSNASTNVTVQLSVNGTNVGEAVKLDTKGGQFAFSIPAANQAAGAAIRLTTANNYNAQITKMVISADGAVVPTKDSAGLSFPKSSYTVTLGEAFETPALSKQTDADPVYSSSKPEVATVDAATGTVTIVAEGTTTITAKTAETEDFQAGEASYTLKVQAPVTTDTYTLTKTVTDGKYIIACEKGVAKNYTGSKAYGYCYLDTEYVPANGSVTCPDKYLFIITNTTNGYTIQGADGGKFYGMDASHWGSFNFYETAAEGNCYWDIAIDADGNAKISNKGRAGAYLSWKAYNQDFELVTTDKEAGTIQLYVNSEAGVNDIVVDEANAPVEYYNLQGVRVANPENGLYIRVQGKKATKVLVK